MVRRGLYDAMKRHYNDMELAEWLLHWAAELISLVQYPSRSSCTMYALLIKIISRNYAVFKINSIPV